MTILAVYLKYISLVSFVIGFFALLYTIMREMGFTGFIKALEQPAAWFKNRLLGSPRLFIKEPRNFLDLHSRQKLRLLINIIVIVLGTRVTLYVLGYMGTVLLRGNTDNFLQSFRLIWNKWDADHYLYIAQNWYGTVGDKKYLIVFYPLYPIVIRFFCVFTRDYFWAGILASNASLILASYYLYLLVQLDYDGEVAQNSVKYLLFYPVSFFLGITFSESLFIAMSLGAIYNTRTRNWRAAGVFAFLASLTRSLGVLLAIPMLIEYIISNQVIEHIKSRQFSRLWHDLLHKGWFFALIPMAVLVYLIINKTVTGDWLKFLEYQKDHWHQSFGLFYKNIEVFVQNSFTWKPADRASLWIPQILLIFAAIFQVFYCIKNLRVSYAAYSFMYLFVCISPTWLLSGPRYIMSIFPLYIAAALLSRNRVIDLILTFASLLFLGYCTLAFAAGYMIM